MIIKSKKSQLALSISFTEILTYQAIKKRFIMKKYVFVAKWRRRRSNNSLVRSIKCIESIFQLVTGVHDSIIFYNLIFF